MPDEKKDSPQPQAAYPPPSNAEPTMSPAPAEEKTGKDAAKLVVYQGGNPAPSPSGDPSGLWSQNDWDNRDPDAGLYQVDESGKLTK